MVNYCQKYFNKDIDDLKISDLKKFFEKEQTESATIEFKSGSGEKLDKGIIKCKESICSFLNTEGGIIIWGAPKEVKVEDARKVCQGQLTYLKKDFKKDQLVNIVTDKISRMPTGIRVCPLRNEKSYLYVFEIQESWGKPHQFDGKYWIRLDGQNRPAPHWLVEALIKQIQYPIIQGYISLQKAFVLKGNYRLEFRVHFLNNSSLPNEENFEFKVRFPEDCRLTEYPSGIEYKGEFQTFPYGRQSSRKFMVEVPQRNQVIDILLFYSGKHSPLKYCKYQVELGESISDTKNCLQTITDNILLSDYHESLGKNLFDDLKTLLDK